MSFPLESVNLISYKPLERLYAAQIIFEFLIKMCIAKNCPIPHRKAPKMHHINTVVPFPGNLNCNERRLPLNDFPICSTSNRHKYRR